MDFYIHICILVDLVYLLYTWCRFGDDVKLIGGLVEYVHVE